jgi:NAD(P)-dependent dehydrogenase (short-subunit alcohol dehydrogenase family)
MTKQTALVTGAGRGIGRGIALELAKLGYAVAGNDVAYDPDDREHGLREVEARVKELGGDFLLVPGDAAEAEDQSRIIKAVLAAFGRVDVLVNNAGVAPLERKDILETTPESYDRLMHINARGAFFLTQKVARLMIKQQEQGPRRHPNASPGPSPSPCVIFISSISAEVSSPSRAEYCISKAALSQTARVYADRLVEFGINVYEIRPGIIKTDMTAAVQDKYDRLIAQGLVPQKKWGYPEDVGRAAAALVRGDFAYATGLILELSGGMNIRHL